MDKQKQINELEKDIAVRMAMAKGVAGSMNNGVEGWLGKYLIEKGWIKPAENAVVLTSERYSDYLITQTNNAYLEEQVKKLQGDNERLYKNIGKFKDTVRKETAEKFAEMAKNAIVNMKWERDDTHIKLVTQEACLIAIDEICKELSEGKV